ncbi:MAG: DUF4153 domain-containing protein [Clostridiaceae bacterium]
MKFASYFRNILTGLYESIMRFPATILLSALVAGILIAINETQPQTNDLGRLAMALALGIPLSLCIKLYFERKTVERMGILAVTYLAGGALIALYYFFFIKELNMVTWTRYTGVSLALYMAFLVVPYFFRKENFEMHVISLFTGFLTAVLYSVVLFAGLSAIIFALQNLLQLNIKDDYYYYSFLFTVFIFGVSSFLADIPGKGENMAAKKYPKLLKVLLLYIVMPLLVIYTAILYLYFGRFALAGAWIEGPVAVSHLILWYGVVLTVTLFFITPIREERKWQKNFFSMAPLAILPLVVMLFAAIGIRINAYGVTERRYFVVALGIWLLFSMIYFIAAKKKLRNILLPISLAAVALFAVFGPGSSYSISMISQNSRLEQLLSKNSMLDKSAIKPSANVPAEDKAQISSIIEYFSSNHKFSDTKFLPGDFQINHMKDVFGFEFEVAPYPYGGYYYYSRDNSETSLNISGYDYFIDSRLMNMDKSKGSAGFSGTYDYGTSVLKLYYDKEKIYEENLNIISNKIVDKYGTNLSNGMIPASDMDYEAETDKYKIKIMFMSISGSSYTENASTAKGLEFYVLIRTK